MMLKNESALNIASKLTGGLKRIPKYFMFYCFLHSNLQLPVPYHINASFLPNDAFCFRQLSMIDLSDQHTHKSSYVSFNKNSDKTTIDPHRNIAAQSKR